MPVKRWPRTFAAETPEENAKQNMSENKRNASDFERENHLTIHVNSLSGNKLGKPDGMHNEGQSRGKRQEPEENRDQLCHVVSVSVMKLSVDYIDRYF